MNKTLISAFVAGSALLLSNLAYASIEEGQLTIWVNYDKGIQGLSQVGEKFTRDTGKHVTVASPVQVEVKFAKNAINGNGPDILIWAHDRFGEWVNAGFLHPLDVSEQYRQKFKDIAWQAVKYDGKYYGYPISIESITLICNDKFIDKPPTAFEDFPQLDKKLKKKGVKPIIWDYYTPYFSYPLISANGGYAFKLLEDGSYDVGDAGVNNKGAKIGMQFLLDMVNQGYLERGGDYGKLDKMFTNNQVGCVIRGPWAWSIYEKENIAFSVYPLPTLHGKPLRPFVGVLAATINEASPNKELAKKFLEEYLLTDTGLETVNNDVPLGAVALNSFQDKLEKCEHGDRIATVMKVALAGDIMPNVPEMSRFWAAFQTAIKNITNGRQSIDGALETAEHRIERQQEFKKLKK